MFRGDPPPRYGSPRRLDTPAGGYLRWAGDRPAVTLERVDVGREPGGYRARLAGLGPVSLTRAALPCFNVFPEKRPLYGRDSTSYFAEGSQDRYLIPRKTLFRSSILINSSLYTLTITGVTYAYSCNGRGSKASKLEKTPLLFLMRYDSNRLGKGRERFSRQRRHD